MALNSSLDNTKLGSYKGENGWVNTGNRNYILTGKAFTRQEPITLTWNLQQRLEVLFWYSYYDIDLSYYLYIVGLDITDQNGKEFSDHNVTLNTFSGAKQLSADKYFPEGLTNKSNLTWSSSDEDVIEVDASGKITAKKYGTATVTATYTVDCTNGRTYIYTDWVNVIVEPSQQLNVTLAPCASSDVAALNAAFDEHLTGSSLLAAAYSEGKTERLALVADPAFGCNTLYLKATVTQGASPADLSQYLCHVYSDDFYLETASAPSGGILYIRLQAKEGAAPANPTDLDIRVDIGTVSDSISVRLYDAPSVELYTGKNWSTDATNGSTSVSSTDKAASYTFKAVMTPELHPYGRSAELDSLTWYLEVPPGYEVEDYLNLTPSGDGTANVTVEQFPDFRVVIHAQSTSAHDPDELNDLADAGHALVFLPNDS